MTNNARSTRHDKIRWLLDHRSLWEGWIGGGANGRLGDPRYRSVVEAMVRDGLVSPRTNWYDLSLNNLITDARSVRRKGQGPNRRNQWDSE